MPNGSDIFPGGDDSMYYGGGYDIASLMMLAQEMALQNRLAQKEFGRSLLSDMISLQQNPFMIGPAMGIYSSLGGMYRDPNAMRPAFQQAQQSMLGPLIQELYGFAVPGWEAPGAQGQAPGQQQPTGSTPGSTEPVPPSRAAMQSKAQQILRDVAAGRRPPGDARKATLILQEAEGLLPAGKTEQIV